jgi:glycosyltransferase involved in cell wall biosynthesis
MTRVLHVISGLGTGGAESFLVSLSAHLASRGFEQTVLSLKGGGKNAERLAAHGVTVRQLGLTGPASLAIAYGPLLDVAREARPDVVQGWMYHGDLAATAAHRLAPSSARLFWGIRCSDMRLENYSAQLRLTVRACAMLSRRPDAILANSRAGADVHVRKGYRARRLIIVPNGIDTQRYRPDNTARAEVRAELGIAPHVPVVIHVARDDPMKDHLTMLMAASRLEGAVALLVGRGTRNMSRPPGIVGLGERPDVARLLSASDVIVSSSAYGEGFSNSLAEGMSAGLVPVATDVGDAREIIGPTGKIVPPGDWDSLARAIRSVIALSAAERAAAGLEARRRVGERFSLERAAERFDALYRGPLPEA